VLAEPAKAPLHPPTATSVTAALLNAGMTRDSPGPRVHRGDRRGRRRGVALQGTLTRYSPDHFRHFGSAVYFISLHCAHSALSTSRTPNDYGMKMNDMAVVNREKLAQPSGQQRSSRVSANSQRQVADPG
jgi:hypothetical protein